MSTPKRRQYGTGSIYKRNDGRWAGAIDAGYTKTGNRRRITVYGKTKREAQDKLRAKRKEILLGELTEGVNTRTTVKTWMDTWLDMRDQTVSPNTAKNERSTSRQWIVPTLGHRRLSDLTPADIRKLGDAPRKQGRSSTTARYAQRIFKQALKAAKVEGHQIPERLLLVDIAKEALSDRDAIPLDQAVAMLRIIATMPDGSRWVSALLQGLRQGEALGLRWEYVDFEKMTLDISWQLDTLNYKNRDQGTFKVPDGFECIHLWKSYHLTRPKTAAGQRLIPMTPWMAESLYQWRQVCPESEFGLVWPRANGLPQLAKADSAAWKRLQDAADVRHESGRYYVLHEARHTTVSLLLAAGVQPEVVRAIVGHSDVAMQQAYTHVDLSRMREAMEAISRQVGM